MMSPGFFEAFDKHLDHFRDDCRRKEFVEFMQALVAWRSTQIIVGMVKAGLADFGAYTPRLLDLSMMSSQMREYLESERLDVRYWEDRYYHAYNDLYGAYKTICRTFPKKEQLGTHHNDPPTSLFEYLYGHFFPKEPVAIVEEYKDKRLCVW